MTEAYFFLLTVGNYVVATVTCADVDELHDVVSKVRGRGVTSIEAVFIVTRCRVLKKVVAQPSASGGRAKSGAEAS